MEPPKAGDVSCSPTWAQPSATGSSIFVACNKSSEIVEIDAAKWKVKRRIPARAGVYNLAVTKDGTRLIATNKRDQSVSIVDMKTVANSRAFLRAGKFSMASSFHQTTGMRLFLLKAIGAEPGTVEIIDLAAAKSSPASTLAPRQQVSSFCEPSRRSNSQGLLRPHLLTPAYPFVCCCAYQRLFAAVYISKRTTIIFLQADAVHALLL